MTDSNYDSCVSLKYTKKDEVDMNTNSFNEGDIGQDVFSHSELLEITKKTLREVFQRDSMLNSLPADITTEEVLEKIAVQHGQSMTIYLVRADGEEISVVVKRKDATVLDLKRAIWRQMMRRLNRRSEKVKVSWRYVWKTYHLSFEKERLKNDRTLLAELNIKNKSQITFVKRLREKNSNFQGEKT